MQAIEELFSPPVYASPAPPRPTILRVKSFSQAPPPEGPTEDDLMGNETIDVEDEKEVTYVRGLQHIGGGERCLGCARATSPAHRYRLHVVVRNV